VQPTDPDETSTQPLDDIWAPRPDATGPTDTVDSAAPATQTGGRRGLRVVGVAGAVLALVAAGAFGALLAGGGDDGPTALTGIGSSTDENGTDEDGTDEDGTDDGGDGTLRDRLKGRGPFGHGLGGPGLVAGGFAGRGVHGSFVVEDADGGYQTVLTQQGTATAVSETSITVKSDDGFVATYRLTDESMVMSGPSGTDAIAKGADVAVTALKTGSTARAVHVIDLSQLKDRFEHHFENGPGSPGGDDDETPQPSSTATSGASV
jgi:hypothetical protein